MRPIRGCPENFRVPEYAHGYFSRNFNGLLFRSILRMRVQNLKFVALPLPGIIRGTRKIWAVPGYAYAPFFSFCSYRPSFSSIFTRFRDIAAFVLQDATFSHPSSSLLKISPCSPGNRWMDFGLRRGKMLG